MCSVERRGTVAAAGAEEGLRAVRRFGKSGVVRAEVL